MNHKRLLACTFIALLSACKGSCSCGTDDGSDDDDTGVGGGATVTVGQGGSGGSGDGGNGDGGSGDGGSGVGGEGGGSTGGVSLRFAHLSPDSVGYNVCLTDLESGETEGPLFDGGIAFKDISEYAAFHSGSYSVSLVAEGAEDCGTPLLETEQVDFALNDVNTIAIIGRTDAEAGEPEELQFAIYNDDLSAPPEGFVAARFIHAAPGAPSVDIGFLDTDGAFVPVWEATEYPLDAGYVDIEAFDTLELVAILAGTGDNPNPLLTVDIQGPEGQIVEGFAVGLPAGAGAEVVTVTTAPAAAE